MTWKFIQTAKQKSRLTEGYSDWGVSVNLPKQRNHPDAIRKKKGRSDIAIHKASSPPQITFEITVHYEDRIEEAQTKKSEQYLNSIKKPE